MDLMKLATQLFLSKLGSSGSNLSSSLVTTALGSLIGDKDGKLELTDLMGLVSGGGLASLAASWLGDGKNDELPASKITDIFGQAKVKDFASQLNLDEDVAAGGLSGMIPDLLDQNSKGGSLLSNPMVQSAAKGILGKLFGR